MPKLNPHDESILKCIKNLPPKYSCNNTSKDKNNKIDYKFPIIFKTDLNSTLLQVQNPLDYGLKDCCYKGFTRITEGSEIK